MRQVKLIKEGISPYDIFQGNISDHYFLSAISALAEQPGRVARLLISDKANEKGCYCIALHLNGLWKEIYLDDFFPVSSSSGGYQKKYVVEEVESMVLDAPRNRLGASSKQTFGTDNKSNVSIRTANNQKLKLMFAHTKHAEIWSMLLEKAYAKANGGYWNIGDGGFADEALSDLTGAPTEALFVNEDTSKDLLWKRLDWCSRNNFVVICGTKKRRDIPGEGVGMNSGHMYNLIGCYKKKKQQRVSLDKIERFTNLCIF